MEWLINLFEPEVLSLLVPIIVIIGGFVYAVINAHYRHQERLNKLKRGFMED